MSKNPNTFETPYNTYHVNKVIGEGGSGRVYEVEDVDKINLR